MGQIEEIFLNSSVLYKKGDNLLRPDDAVDKIYFLKKGNVRQYAITAKGEEVVIHIFHPGSFFPIMLVLAESANRFYFETMTNVEVKIAPPDKVVNFLKANPEVLFTLTQRLSKGLNGIVTRLEETLSNSVKERLASFLGYLSNHFGKDVRGGRQITLTLSHQDISSWLGVARETVTRQMKSLQKSKIISYKGRKIIVKSL